MKPLLRWMLFLALACAAGGCAAQTTQMEACPATGCEPTTSPTTPYYRELEQLAVAELACPAAQLQYYTVAHAVGDAVAGCGKKALYVKLCSESDPFQVACHPSRASDWR